MATFNKFNQFTKDLVDGVHDFDAHVFRVMLTNTAPSAGNATKSELTDLSAANGYTAGGLTSTITTSTSSGTAKVTGADVTFSATGSMGPFRYAVLYNDTATSPADPLIGYWDYGSSVTMANTETFLVDFDATNGILTVA